VVIARARRWQVIDVRVAGSCCLLSLRETGGRWPPVERRLLLPFDTIEPAVSRSRPRVVRAAAWRSACRALLAEHALSGSLRSIANARIELLPHQLEPALAVIRGHASRLLLADEVGLGKTIQAGIVLAELKARRAADRALVVAPGGLRDQWVGELTDRFDLRPFGVDLRTLRRRVAELPIGVPTPGARSPSRSSQSIT
jgi:hypothetical protein